MKTGQQITLGLASALIIISLWTGQQIQPVWNALTNQDTSVAITPYLKNIGLDIVFLVVVTWLAGLSDDAGMMTSALLVAMWLLYLMHPSKRTYITVNPGSWINI